MRLSLSRPRTSPIFVVFTAWVGLNTTADAETFYLCQGGNGSQPQSPQCGAYGTCWNADDFNQTSNWDSDEEEDGKIGPGDRVVILDDGGPLRRSSGVEVLDIRRSGSMEKPITIQGETRGSASIDGENSRRCIFSQERSHLIIENLECTRGEPFGIDIWDSDFVTIKDSKVHGARRANIVFSGTHGLVTRCELYNSREEHGLYFTEEFTRDCTVEFTHVHGNATAGIQFNSDGTNQKGMVCRYNWLENNGKLEINNLAMEDGEINGNILVNSTGGAYHAIYFGDDGPGDAPKNVKVHNNTIYGNYGWVVSLVDQSTEIHFVNNIVHKTDNQGVIIEIEAGSSAVLDNNIYHRDNLTGAWASGNSAYSSLSEWQTALGGCPGTGRDCSSNNSWPEFVDPLNGNFTLLDNSPAIDSAAELSGSQYNMVLDAVSMKSEFGPHVQPTLADQNTHGSGWEIGAYVFGSDLSNPHVNSPPMPKLLPIQK
jgi:hypothetical protein